MYSYADIQPLNKISSSTTSPTWTFYVHVLLIPSKNKNKLCSMTCGRVPAKGASGKQEISSSTLFRTIISEWRGTPYFKKDLLYKTGLLKSKGGSHFILKSNCEIRWLVLSTLELYSLLLQYHFRMKRDPPFLYIKIFLVYKMGGHSSFWNHNHSAKEEYWGPNTIFNTMISK